MSMQYSLGLYEKALPLQLDFRQMLWIALQNGFDRLEISIDESEERLQRLFWPLAQQRALGSLSREIGVPITTMCLSAHRKYPLGSQDVRTRERSFDILKRAVDFSRQSGISVIQLAGYDVYYEESTDNTKAFFEEGLHRAVEIAAGSGVMLAFETMETSFMDTACKAMHYVRAVDSPWLQIYPDIGNMTNASVMYGHDVCEDLLSGKGHICAMHLKETKPGVYRDMAFGAGGHIDYVRCIAAALSIGVRLYTAELWYRPGQNYPQVIKQANAFLRAKFHTAIGQNM